MARQTVLIPGGGGAAAVGAIKALRRSDLEYRVVATDADELSAGLYLADAGYTVPRADDETFIDLALDVIEMEDVDVVLPSSGFDIYPYAEHRQRVANAGATAVVTDAETLRTCRDKLRFDAAVGDEFRLPETTTDPSDVPSFPRFVKPVTGKGSQNVAVCHDRDELERAIDTDDEMLIQEYLPGTEYTVDVLSDLEGNALAAIPRERVETKAGISYKGRTVLDEELQTVCLDLAEQLGLVGPSCMQLKRATDGTPKLIEVNPRLGGGSIIATLAGVNLPALTVEMAVGETPAIPEPEDVTVVRYWEEAVVTQPAPDAETSGMVR